MICAYVLADRQTHIMAERISLLEIPPKIVLHKGLVRKATKERAFTPCTHGYSQGNW